RISRGSSRPSRSSTDSRTASASPLRVRVIRSCCWRTRRASSDRRAFASDSGTGVAAIVMVRNIACISQILDYLRTGCQALQPLRSRSREADPGNLRLLSRHAAGTLASLAGTGAASARGRLEVAGEGADAGERVRNAAGLLDPGQVPGSRDYVTSADGISAAVCCPWLPGRGLCAPRTKATGTLMAPGDPAKPAARCPATEATVPAQAASETRICGGPGGRRLAQRSSPATAARSARSRRHQQARGAPSARPFPACVRVLPEEADRPSPGPSRQCHRRRPLRGRRQGGLDSEGPADGRRAQAPLLIANHAPAVDLGAEHLPVLR